MSVEDSSTEKKKKKKRKYSKGFKSLQQTERGASRAGHRLASAVEGGLRSWRKNSDKSARKKKDGSIKDGIKNATKSLGRSLRTASWAPHDFIKGAKPSITPRKVLARIFLPF